MGYWMCVALVVGNMIGSGVFLLPATLAPFGWNAVLGWIVTIAGAMCLALVFARLARANPQAGGPYAYTQQAFGPLPGFLVAWTYWISVVIGNVAIATGSVSYLSVLFPQIATMPGLAPLLALAAIWGLTGLNCLGARAAGGFQFVTTVLKLTPLIAVAVVAAVVVVGTHGATVTPLHLSSLNTSSVMAASTLALWGLLGLESATVPADKVIDPQRTIPLATLTGTAATGMIYLVVCSAVLLMLPAEQVARSHAPFADFMSRYLGGKTGAVLAAFAALSGFGALNGWVMLQGELPRAMAVNGVFPAWLARTSANGAPVRAHILSSTLLTLVLMTNYSRSMTDLFAFFVLLATTATLFAYLFCSLAALRLQAARRLDRSAAFSAVAVLGAVYSVWAVYGAGRDAALWGLVFLISGIPVFLIMRRRRRP